MESPVNNNNYIITAIILVLVSLHTLPVHSSHTCLNNTRKLTQRYDNKEYHLVDCDCPCSKYTSYERGQCSKCGHYHESQNIVILETKDMPLTQEELKKSLVAVNNKRDIISTELITRIQKQE